MAEHRRRAGGWLNRNILGYAMTSASVLVFVVATSWWHVVLGRTAQWIGWSIRTPVRDALLARA
jgi:hypothetical protein